MKTLLMAALALLSLNVSAGDDPHLWLEDVTGSKPLEWVREQNARSTPVLEAVPGFQALQARLLGIVSSPERIPYVVKRGEHLYNVWKDAAHPRGLLRRTTLAEYRRADPKWEPVLDLTRLSADEGEAWDYKGMECLVPEHRRCLISLSRGGADAVEVREFDMVSRQFVKDGFRLAESKGWVSWVDADTIYLARDFGPGSLTRSGYPRIVKSWKRGTPLAEARTLFEARPDDVLASGWVQDEAGRSHHRIRRVISTRVAEEFLLHEGQWTLIAAPRDAEVNVFDGLLVLRLRSDWKPADITFKAGSLIAGDLDRFMAGGRDFELLFEPGPRVFLDSTTFTRNALLLELLDNVKARVLELRRVDGRWQRREVAVPPMSSVNLTSFDRLTSDDYWLTVTSFIEPTTLYLSRAGTDARERMKALPAFFDARGLVVAQHEATSKDGTRVPYFVVRRAGAGPEGRQPTILYGYGGFEVSQTPAYSGTVGAAWLERGGAWVVANVRGGGEFGPEWHRAARREGRQKAHDDFIAVAEDLVRRGITSPARLGIYGGSQGGLLVGAAFTQRPELFKAVVSTVPLLDMQRYHKLLAGASWMGEYGDPDQPADWAFISKYSPYQNLAKDRRYPKVLITTTTRDDRVHPGHARKMVARMLEQGHEVLYFENAEGGHGSGSTPAQQAYVQSLIYAFFRRELE